MFDWIFSLLVSNENNLKSSAEVAYWPDRTSAAKLAALESLEKIPIDLQWEKCFEHSGASVFEWIFFIRAGNEDMHKSLD